MMKTYISLSLGVCLSYGMSKGKVPKAFSYSFNLFHVSHSSVEGGPGKISDWISGVKKFKWEQFLNEFLLRNTFLFGKLCLIKHWI